MRRIATHGLAFGLSLLGALGLLFGAGAPARGESGTEQVYFVGMAQVAGSISAPGSATTRVYLRWDVTEGELPADVASFKILRGGLEIADIPATSVMPAAQIAGLYAGPAQVRRKNEIIRWLNEEAAASGKPAVTDMNFADVIHDRLDPEEPEVPTWADDAHWEYDPLWAQLASRVDINIARARRRAFVDFSPPAGPVEYELKAHPSGDRLGLVQVEDTDTNQIITAAGSFAPVTLSRCDLPGRFRDHGVVALNWDLVPATMSAADRYVVSLMVAGYDLYRTIGNVSESIVETADLPDVDIRVSALLQGHDANGNVTLANLEKVNDQPIVVSGRSETETASEVYNPPFSQFVETLAELAARGVRPGDRRGYYLVARDFTGNYGATAKALVKVPDLIAPPAPWSVSTDRSTADPDGRNFVLTWPRVDVRNYEAGFSSADRTYCNLDSARFERELRYAPEGSTCEAGSQVTVDLDVEAYLVYRFDVWQDGSDPLDNPLRLPGAATFKDSDGDGRSDSDERGADPSDVGTACNDGSYPSGATNYLVDVVLDSSAVSLPSGRKIIEFVDPTPFQNRNDVFWYRIASRGWNGSLSPLSEPIRALFPDRTKPARSLLDVRFTGNPDCPPGLFGARVRASSNLDLPFAIDATASDAASAFRIGCTTTATEFVAQIEDLGGGVRGASLPASACKRLRVDCPADVYFQFEDGLGAPLAGPTAYPTIRALDCRPDIGMRNAELFDDCVVPDGVEVEWGEVVTGPVLVCIPALQEPSTHDCVSVYRESPGGPHRLRTICDPEACLQLDLPNLGGESICLSVALHSESNVLSTRERLPCYRTQVDAPPAPQPVGIAFDVPADPMNPMPGEPTDATVTWVPPEQPSAGTIVEWYEKGQAEHSTLFVPHVFDPDADPDTEPTLQDGAISLPIALSPWSTGAAWQEEWCFRARTMGRHEVGREAEVLSKWSPELCAVRAATLPDYLPWPKIPEPPEGDGLTAFYMSHAEDQLPGIVLSDPDTSINIPGSCGLLDFCNPENGTDPACLGDAIDEPVTVPCALCPLLDRALGANLGFVAYRQSLADGVTSEFSQVSPLIDDLFCQAECGGSVFVPPPPNFCASDSDCTTLCAIHAAAGCGAAENLCDSTCGVASACDGGVCVGGPNDGMACITDAECEVFECSCTCKPLPGQPAGSHTLADPFIKLVSSQSSGHQLVFVDRYPHVGGREYRYQLVYFDGNGEIVSYRTTDWVNAD